MRILILAPDIEDPSFRGIQMIFLNLLRGLKASGHTLALVASFPLKADKIKNAEIKQKLQEIYLRHYLAKGPIFGKKGRAPLVKLYIKTFIGILFARINRFSLRQTQEHEDIPWLQYIDEIIHIPYLNSAIRFNISRFNSSFIKRAVKKYTFDMVITAAPVKLSRLKNIKVVQFVHDLIPLEMSEDPIDGDNIFNFATTLASTLKNTDIILTNSEDTKRRLLACIPNKNIEVLYSFSTLRHNFEESEEKSVLNKWQLERNQYFVFVSGLEKRKNLERLLDAFSNLSTSRTKTLAIAGKPGYGYEELIKIYKTLPLPIKNRIKFLGYVSQNEKAILLKNAFAMVFPTLYEGVGIPVLEAFHLRCPVIVSRVGGIPEIAQDSAIYIENPYISHDITKAMQTLLQSPHIRDELIEKGSRINKQFSFEKFSERLQMVLEK